jgi:DNA-binding MarR family transcriptional regulator
VLRQFRSIVNAVRKHFRATERKAGISGAHIWALSVIAEQPATGVGALAQAMDVHQSTASNLLRTLAAEGYVNAERDAQDRRALRLTLTAKGRRIMKSAVHPYTGVLPEALEQLPAATLRRLERDLAELIAMIDPTGKGAHLPLGRSED